MTTSRDTPVSEATEEPGIVLRSPAVLMDLPVAYRWEVTRRHPYYLRFWELAHRHHTQPSADPLQRALEQAAVALLLGIGVSGDPPSPGSSAESLGAGSLSQAWESGAVAPITFRGLVGMLLSDLPPELLVQVGRLFQERGTAAGTAPDEKYRALTDLQALRHLALDAFPARPVVGVNIEAPLRIITQAVEQFARQWKEQQGISERRRRDDKLADYLAVWDAREAWQGDRYGSTRELTLQDIARQVKVPLSTAANRYRSAFELIVGRAYSPALWAQVFGVLKLSEWLDPDELPRRTLRRPWRDRRPRVVPEAALAAPEQSEGASGVLSTVAVCAADSDYAELILDIRLLLAEGRTNPEIVAALELTSPDAEAAIEYLRQRQDLG